MNIKTVIFDLDGTLLDTLGDLTDAVNEATASRGIPPASTEQIRQRVGNGIRTLMRLSLPEGTPEDIIDACLGAFRAHYGDHMMCRTRPYAGVTEVLQALKGAGVQVAVLSNKYDPAAKALTEYYFPGLIDLTLGERQGVPRKPDPTACHEVLSMLSADAASTVYIGDSDVDMQTAKNAGLRAIGVTWGFRPRASLAAAGADVLADLPYELHALLLGADVPGLRQAFTARGFGFSYFDTAAEATAYLAQTCAGKHVGFGGSVTLDGMGMYEALQDTAEVHWHWSGEAPVVDAEIFLTSANGLAATGEVVNIDGACNRVAASLWGAKECFVVCGINKLAPTLEAAISRAREIAAPRNAQRLGRHTPCTADGQCHDCRSAERICRALVVLMGPPIPMERTEIVLIGETLGY